MVLWNFNFLGSIKGSTYYSVVITLYANLSNGIIYKVNYEEGHGKRVRGYSNNILKKMKMLLIFIKVPLIILSLIIIQ